MFGKWKKIADGYGKIMLGYFGKTLVSPDSEFIRLASQQLKLEPTIENAVGLADKDVTKSLGYTKKILEDEGLEVNDENLFIILAYKEQWVVYLKGKAKVNVRRIDSSKNTTQKVAHLP